VVSLVAQADPESRARVRFDSQPSSGRRDRRGTSAVPDAAAGGALQPVSRRWRVLDDARDGGFAAAAGAAACLGAAVLSDAELIAVLLRSGRRGHGVVDEAHRLLHDAGGLIHVARMEVSELTRRAASAPPRRRLVAAIELGQRCCGTASATAAGSTRRMPPASSGVAARRERRECSAFLSRTAATASFGFTR